jgi:hypothetical protein
VTENGYRAGFDSRLPPLNEKSLEQLPEAFVLD